MERDESSHGDQQTDECPVCGGTEFEYANASGSGTKVVKLAFCEGCGVATGEVNELGLFE